MGATPVVDVVGLRKNYGDTAVLSDVSLHAEAGQTITLLGPNGAGKTTTVEIIRGLIKRDSGSVNVLGEDPANGPGAQWQARIGMTLQSQSDHSKWRVREFLNWIHASYVNFRDCRTVSELIDSFELGKHAYKTISTLSGGLRRRLDLAAALVARPDLLILDEPTSGLDPAAKRAIHDIVTDQVDAGTALILTTHDLSEADRLSDSILILDEGRIIAQGSPESLRLQVERQAEITWTSGGHRQFHATTKPEAFLRELLRDMSIDDLEVSRTSLEDAYLALVDGKKGGSTLARPSDELTARSHDRNSNVFTMKGTTKENER